MDAERENGYSCDSGDTIDGRIVRYAIGADGTIGAMEEITPGSVSEVTGIGQEQIRQGDSLEYGFSGISASRRTPGLVIASTIVKDDGDSIFLSEDYGTTWKQILFDLVSGRASGGGERAQEKRPADGCHRHRFLPLDQTGRLQVWPRDWPDPDAMVKELKEMGIETVVSVWPTIDERSENFGTKSEMGYLVNADRGNQNHMTWMGNTVFYDATHPGAQKFVWEKCKENYYKKGIRCFWLDEAEPEYGPYDFDNYRYYAGLALQCSNVYPVGYAKGFYEGLKAEGEKDILSLVRCAWAGSQKSFNPIRFQPEEWAQTAKDCGFKYLILTTKHHDGFCLWDTRYSDYKVTAPDCPYHVSEHADLVKSMFDAFREKGLGIGAYFSKADWHTPYYRAPELPDPNPSDRGPMYSPAAEPERWENFVQYTKNQVLELCEGYGPIDILWFDAGWVCASNGQDIRLGEWLKVYGEAIYGTRVCAPYQSGNISFTRKGDAVYAIRLFPVAQESVDSKLFIPYAGKVSKVTMLDSGEDVSFVPGEGGITVTVPAGRRGGSAPIALVFKLQ